MQLIMRGKLNLFRLFLLMFKSDEQFLYVTNMRNNLIVMQQTVIISIRFVALVTCQNCSSDLDMRNSRNRIFPAFLIASKCTPPVLSALIIVSIKLGKRHFKLGTMLLLRRTVPANLTPYGSW